jgi:hypothetical protein
VIDGSNIVAFVYFGLCDRGRLSVPLLVGKPSGAIWIRVLVFQTLSITPSWPTRLPRVIFQVHEWQSGNGL